MLCPRGEAEVANIEPFMKDVRKRLRIEREFKAPPRRKKKAPVEKKPEREASRLMREDGAAVVKVNVLGQKAWPDRFIAPPGVKVRVVTCWTVEQAMYQYERAKHDGVVLFIEFKRDAKHQLTELQSDLQRRLMFGQDTKPRIPRARPGRVA